MIKPLRIRSQVLAYQRDTRLGVQLVLNPEFAPINCDSGSSPFGFPVSVREAHAAFDVASLMRYPDRYPDATLAPAILVRFADANIKREQLFFGHGSFNLAERIIHKLAQPEALLGIGPQFNEIPSEFIAAGGVYRTMRIRAEPPYTFPHDAMVRSLASGAYSMCYLDNPNNPTGLFLSLEQVREYVDAAAPHGTIMLIDEAFADTVPDAESAMHLVSAYNNVIVMRAFSKGLGLAGARIGYMACAAPIAEFYRQLDVPFEPSAYSTHVARAALSDHGFLAGVRYNVRSVKQRIMDACAHAGLQVLPTHPATLTMALHDPGRDLGAAFAAVGVAVAVGRGFQKTHPEWNDAFCRLRVVPQPEADELCRRIALLGSVQASSV
ncbi:MAG: aminotransferase class I/II-fold pyridoxal phosphate-dependent enzyme [bacterium]|nr:aminotransferase class I/II-fold pyridoxal phosphate-dependent enzyme [bacterium]